MFISRDESGEHVEAVKKYFGIETFNLTKSRCEIILEHLYCAGEQHTLEMKWFA